MLGKRNVLVDNAQWTGRGHISGYAEIVSRVIVQLSEVNFCEVEAIGFKL